MPSVQGSVLKQKKFSKKLAKTDQLDVVYPGGSSAYEDSSNKGDELDGSER